MSTNRPIALASGATTGAAVGRLLGIGALGTLLGIAAGLYAAYMLTKATTVPTV